MRVRQISNMKTNTANGLFDKKKQTGWVEDVELPGLIQEKPCGISRGSWF